MTSVETTEAPEATVETPETQAPVARADDRYPADEVSAELARRVLAARAAGWSRTQLQVVSELTPAQLWRIENGRVHRHEVEQLAEVLSRIESGELAAPAQNSRGRSSTPDDRDERIRRALELLDEAVERRSAAQVREGVGAARAVLAGETPATNDAADAEVTGSESEPEDAATE
jgi:hypothetical protein